MNTMPDKPQKSKPQTTPLSAKPPQCKNTAKKDSFVVWIQKNRAELREEFPDLSNFEFTKVALARYKEKFETKTIATTESKKRKLSSPESQDEQSKRSVPNKLAAFICDK